MKKINENMHPSYEEVKLLVENSDSPFFKEVKESEFQLLNICVKNGIRIFKFYTNQPLSRYIKFPSMNLIGILDLKTGDVLEYYYKDKKIHGCAVTIIKK